MIPQRKKRQGNPTKTGSKVATKTNLTSSSQQPKVPVRKSGTFLQKSKSISNARARISKRALNLSSNGGGVVETLSKIYDTGKDVVRDVAKVASSDPTVFLTAPSTLMKVVDVTKNIISNITEKDGKKPILSGPVKSKEDHQILEKLKEAQPVINTTILPTASATNVEMPTMTQEPKVYPGGRRGFNIKGSYFTGRCGSAKSNVDTWYGLPGGNAISASNNSLFGDRVASILQLHQLFRVNSCTLTFMPFKGMNYEGNVMLNIADGIDTVMGTSVTMEVVSQRENVAFGDLKTPLSLTVKGLSDWLWCNNTGSRDPKFFASMCYGVCVFSTANTSSDPDVVPCGNIFFTFDVDCMSATETAYSLGGIIRREITSNWLSNTNVVYKDLYCLYLAYVLKEYLESLDSKSDSDFENLTTSNIVMFLTKQKKSFSIPVDQKDVFAYIQNASYKREFHDVVEDILKFIDTNEDLKSRLGKFGFHLEKALDTLLSRMALILDCDFTDEDRRYEVLFYLLETTQRYCYEIFRSFNPLEVSLIDEIERDMRPDQF